MAEVHLARQRGLKRFRKLVVVKTIHHQLARDERFIDLLLEEARISALLKHPRVVDIYDVGEENGVYFIAMEYLPGQSLTEVIRAGRRGGKLDVWSAARIIADAAEGLDAAHRLKSLTGEDLGLVHRDVSPGNIVVLYSGEVKLVDFGVAKARGHLAHQKIGKFAGKLGYAAPEQLLADAADCRSDIFSLGVVLWELLCHRRLFNARSRKQALRMVQAGNAPLPSKHRRETPAALDAICMRALEPYPDRRFQHAREMVNALEAALRRADVRRENIAAYMEATFREERLETEMLVARIAEATGQLDLADLEADGGEDDPDEDMPTRIDPVFPRDVPRTMEVEPVEEPETDAATRTQALSDDDLEQMTGVETRPEPGRLKGRGGMELPPPVAPRAKSPQLPAGKASEVGKGEDAAEPPARSAKAASKSEEAAADGAEAAARATAEDAKPTGSTGKPAAPADGKPEAAASAAAPAKLGGAAAAKSEPAKADDESAAAGSEDEAKDAAEPGGSSASEVDPDADTEAATAVEDALDPAILDAAAAATIIERPLTPWRRLRAVVGPLLHRGHPWHRPMALVAAVALGMFALILVVEVAKSGTSREIAAPAGTGTGALPAVEPGLTPLLDAGREAPAAMDASRAAIVADAAPAPAAAMPDAAPTPAPPVPKPAPARPARPRPAPPKKAVPPPRPEPKAKHEPSSGPDREAARSHYQTAMRAFSRGQLAVAEKGFHAALGEHAGFSSAHRALGFVYARQGNKAQAIRHFKSYLRMSPRAKDTPIIRARIAELGG
jgi:serine/threonine-protein kinase